MLNAYARATGFASLLLLAVGCTPPVVQGGNNENDRTNGGEQGEKLLTGAMVVSPDGKYVIAQRNETSVLLDVDARKAHELEMQVDRVVFSKTGGRAIFVLADKKTIIAYDLAERLEQWRTELPDTTSTQVSLLRLSEDSAHLVVGDEDEVRVFDASVGKELASFALDSLPTELTFVPNSNRALIVGTTRWLDHKPDTAIVEIDLSTLQEKRISIPNCNAPIVVLPDASRALLSPTFCEEARASSQASDWTNPDPVSVIDLTAEGPKFIKNLPGFGPVAMDDKGERAVAYLDVQRMDETMFDDPQKIPNRSGTRYHIMTIDPQTLDYELTAIGDVLPRFAMTRDGKSLMVDATVQRLRGDASVKATIDENGMIRIKLKLFNNTDSLFGLFDLESRTYQPFAGAAASLDRFVQLADARHVYTLKLTLDGMGGDLHRIDLQEKKSTSLGMSLRDIGLLGDGATLLLRKRLPAVKVETSAGISWYRRESYCFSSDGTSCSVSIDFQDSKPFQSGPSCTSYHDC